MKSYSLLIPSYCVVMGDGIELDIRCRKAENSRRF